MGVSRILLFFAFIVIVESDMMMPSMSPDMSPLYDALIVLNMDSMILPGSNFGDISPEMDTEMLRLEAFNFFLEYYGINMSNPNLPLIVQKNSVNRTVAPYSVLAMAVPGKNGDPLYKIPMTNTFVKDDYYQLFVYQRMLVNGTYGEQNGKYITKNSFIVYGKYRFLTTCPGSGMPIEFMDPITFKGICPMTAVDYAGDGNPDLTTGTFPFVCQLEHPVFGTGMARGLTVNMKIMDDPNSPMRMSNTVNVMQFPDSIMDRMGSPLLTETRNIVPGGTLCMMDSSC